MIMKVLSRLLIATLLSLVSISMSSQELNTIEEKAADLTSKMQEAIGFSNENKDKVYDINVDFLSKMQSLKLEEDSKIKKFKGLKQLDEKRDKALKEIFNKEEFESFEKFKEENKETIKQKFKAARNQKAN